MIDQLIRIGDEVVITIPQENREGGYNPCPDGTQATVLGFSEIHYGRIGNFGYKPGVYLNRACVKVRLPDGKEHIEYSSRLELADTAEDDQRHTTFRMLQQEQPDHGRNKEFLRDLPETPFWECDFVRVGRLCGVMSVHSEIPPNHLPDVLQVIGIDYRSLTEHTTIGTKYPAYQISYNLGTGWHTSANEDDMVLIERGLVWKFYHEMPITFRDTKDEAQFFEALGHTEEVRNPVNNLYDWTKEEVLEAIKKGLVHGFSVSRGFFGARPLISAKRFKNEDLGQRVAQATLKGFRLDPA